MKLIIIKLTTMRRHQCYHKKSIRSVRRNCMRLYRCFPDLGEHSYSFSNHMLGALYTEVSTITFFLKNKRQNKHKYIRNVLKKVELSGLLNCPDYISFEKSFFKEGAMVGKPTTGFTLMRARSLDQ
jgi:hypothetical protein